MAISPISPLATPATQPLRPVAMERDATPRTAAETSRAQTAANGNDAAARVAGLAQRPESTTPPTYTPVRPAPQTEATPREAKPAQGAAEPSPRAADAQAAYQFQTSNDAATRQADARNQQQQQSQQRSIDLMA